MSPIRVLVANRPRLIRELIMATISDQPDIEIVGEVAKESEVMAAVEQSRPDFIIIALDKTRRLPAFCEAILQEHPQLKVIAISPDKNNTVFYWASLRIQSNQIEASEAGVLGALRSRQQPAERIQ
jgi:DNA-binding NarL/FixJ family response regulator